MRHWFALLLIAACTPALAGPPHAPPSVAVILDDMGYDLARGEAALTLPQGVTYAFLPQAPHTQILASEARRQQREIMLHLPMQAMGGRPLDAGGLTVNMDEVEFQKTLERDLAALPDAVGVNNHMGSLLTRHPGAMAWLMRGLARHGGLFYVDSRTHKATVAQQEAVDMGLAATRRDVFLDNSPRPADIAAQLRLLVRKARLQGSAVGIGHPYPETIAVLARQLPRLARDGIALVPVSAVIHQQQRRHLWQASSSPSQTVAKSSKP
jgi:polysaccharide deacetylase 2 family uncharacterized protein YibQ